MMERSCVILCGFFLVIVDGLTPYLKNVDELCENTESLVKLLSKVDAYTKQLENRANQLFDWNVTYF